MRQGILGIITIILIVTLIIVGFATKNIRIKNLLRIVFFPFITKKYHFLEKKRGYRLLKTLFLLGLLFSLGFFIIEFTNAQNEDIDRCTDFIYSINHSNVGDLTKRDNARNECDDIHKVTLFRNILLSLLITLGINYVIQFIYFKMVIYITYGEIKK